MEYIQILGLAAAAFTTGANFPQTYKIIKTKSTKDISKVTYGMLFLGGIMWLIYGILKSDVPIIIANGISSTICGIIFMLKLSSRKLLEELDKKI
ncbi:MtN3 and saliva related transmembrane protein [Flavobacterium sp. CG_23.5]|uniref:SemiSWEET family sugar transporter n=1 Tax=Flavobacterium sp. CG_23.5 TaxID=2760708 RepID=UPI001AE66B15|nr:SemiSWEET transporter [Flavobacterium sp. CG_23.5]MBP2282473.1 MtN3 and saliva related transmembrane protein [Flavobacterium sp. CG_23.5]